MAILAAPASLCLVGYFSLSTMDITLFIYILVPLSLVMTLWVYFLLFKLLKIKFNPGISASTFPLVISAIGMLKFAEYLTNSGVNWGGYVQVLGLIEYGIAVIVVIYVGIRYLHFYLIAGKSSKSQELTQ